MCRNIIFEGDRTKRVGQENRGRGRSGDREREKERERERERERELLRPSRLHE